MRRKRNFTKIRSISVREIKNREVRVNNLVIEWLREVQEQENYGAISTSRYNRINQLIQVPLFNTFSKGKTGFEKKIRKKRFQK